MPSIWKMPTIWKGSKENITHAFQHSCRGELAESDRLLRGNTEFFGGLETHQNLSFCLRASNRRGEEATPALAARRDYLEEQSTSLSDMSLVRDINIFKEGNSSYNYRQAEITWTIRQNWDNKFFLAYVLPQVEAIVQLAVMVIMMKAVVGILTYI